MVWSPFLSFGVRDHKSARRPAVWLKFSLGFPELPGNGSYCKSKQNSSGIYYTSPIFSVAQQQTNWDLGRFIVEVSRTHTIRHTHTHTHTHTHKSGRTLLKAWLALRKDRYLYNTQQTQENANPSHHLDSNLRSQQSISSDLRLRPHGHRDQPVCS